VLIRWAYNPDLQKIGTVDEVDDELANVKIGDGWAVKVDDAEAPSTAPPEEHHDDEAGGA
jgi:hypothetical protein